MKIGIGISATLTALIGGTIGSGLVDGHPLYAYTRPTFLTDFLTGWYELSGTKVSAFSSLPSISIARASTGYAQTAAGVLTSFASGAARITDKGLLVEGAATNLALQSQTFDNASWTKSRTTITANAATAPDGTSTADKLVEDSTAAASHRTFQGFTKAASAITYTYSVFLKAGERTFAQVKIASAGETNSATVYVNLTTGALDTPAGAGFTGISAAVVALADGWYRVSLTATSDTDTSLTAFVFLASALGTISYSGDNASGIYVWGAQLETGAFASSYIPTTTGSATRAADVISLPVSGLAYPMTLFAEVDFPTLKNSSASSSFLQVDDGDSSDRALLYSTVGAGTGARMYVAAASVQQALPSVGTLAVGVRKMAARCAANSFQVAGGGTLATEDTSGSAPGTPTTIRFGRETSGGTEAHAYLRRLAIWPTAFTDAQLQAVTA